MVNKSRKNKIKKKQYKTKKILKGGANFDETIEKMKEVLDSVKGCKGTVKNKILKEIGSRLNDKIESYIFFKFEEVYGKYDDKIGQSLQGFMQTDEVYSEINQLYESAIEECLRKLGTSSDEEVIKTIVGKYLTSTSGFDSKVEEIIRNESVIEKKINSLNEEGGDARVKKTLEEGLKNGKIKISLALQKLERKGL